MNARLALPAAASLAVVLVAQLAGCEPAPCCTRDEECGGELGCFDNRCSFECESNEDCVPSEVCVRPLDGRARGVCVAPGEDDGECRERVAPEREDAGPNRRDAGRPRDAGGDGPAPDCPADRHEPNNSRTFATNSWQNGEELTICRFDEDWFNIRLDAGDRVRARIDFEHARGDLGLELFAPLPQGGLIDASLTSEDVEEVVFTAARSTTYAVRVSGAQGARNRYELTILVIDTGLDAGPQLDAGPSDGGRPSDGGGFDAGDADGGPTDGGASDGGAFDAGHPDGGRPPCADDAFENNDSLSQAVPFWTSPLVGRACPFDEDWYALDLLAGDTAQIDLKATSGTGNTDLAIYDVNGVLLAASTLVDQPDAVTLSSTADVRHFIRVYTTNTSAAYTLERNIVHDGGVPTDAGPGCYPDSFEPNDTQATASLFHPPASPATLCGSGDVDFYAIPISGPTNLVLEVQDLVDIGNADIELRRPNGSIAASSATNNFIERIERTVSIPGTWALVVRERGGSGIGDYRYRIDVSPILPPDGGPPDGGSDAGPCTDALEPNDSRGQATSAWQPTNQLEICPGDEDWFNIPLQAGEELRVDLLFTHQSGDLDMALFGPAGNIVELAQGVTDVETIVYPAPGDGRFRLRVYGFNDATNPYTLLIDVRGADAGPPPMDAGPTDSGAPDGGACGDALEPNETFETARPDWQPVNALEICPFDEDWFLIPALPGQAIDIRMTFIDADGDLDMTLHDENGAVVAASQGISDEEDIFFVAPAPGAYRLRVYGFNGATNPYTLFIDGAIPTDAGPGDAGAFCVDDALEENDSRMNPTPYAIDGDGVSAVLCPDDPDIFVLPAAAAAEYRAELIYGAPPGMRLAVSRPGQGLLGASATGTGLEEVTFTSTFPGPVFLAVSGVPTGEVARPYQLFVERIDEECVDDDLEDNDVPVDATPLFLPTTVDGMFCAADVDFFTAFPGLRDELTVTLTAPADSGLSATAVRLSDFTVFGIVAAGTQETFDIGPVPSGPITIIVSGLGDAAYSLEVE